MSQDLARARGNIEAMRRGHLCWTLFALIVSACGRPGEHAQPLARPAASPLTVYTGGPPLAAIAERIPCPRWYTQPHQQWRCVDADLDGVPDRRDRCPEEAEVFNAVEDDDGCPDAGESLVVIDEARGMVELKRRIEFASGKANIAPESLVVLEHVAAVLRVYDRIALLEIAAHDWPREERYGLRITDARARAVRDVLVDRGVDPQRLQAVGYGEDQPIVPNRTAEGRRQNQRIELRIRRHALAPGATPRPTPGDR